jgi:hypothetical protein
MKRAHVVVGLAAGFVSLIAVQAFAGKKTAQEVFVNPISRYAYGALGSARNSADSTQYIGCYVDYSASEFFGGCEAKSASGAFASCYFPAATFEIYEKILSTQGANPYFWFNWNPDGSCASFEVDSFSHYRPITP